MTPDIEIHGLEEDLAAQRLQINVLARQLRDVESRLGQISTQLVQMEVELRLRGASDPLRHGL
jgi:hypothetical protein